MIVRSITAVIGGIVLAIGLHHIDEAHGEAVAIAGDRGCSGPLSFRSPTHVRDTFCHTYAGTVERAYVETAASKKVSDIDHIVVSTAIGTFDELPGHGDDDAMTAQASRHLGERVALRFFHGRPMLLATPSGVSQLGAYVDPVHYEVGGRMIVAVGLAVSAFALLLVPARRSKTGRS